MLHIMNQKKRGSERKAEQRGENIMDKGSNEAERERWQERERGGQGKVMWRREDKKERSGKEDAL